MNKLLKFSLILLVAVGFNACDSTDDDTSFLNDRTTISYFVPGSQGTLAVEPTGISSFDVAVGVSEAKPFDRTFTYTLDPSSSAVEGVDFTISTTLSVPANSVVGIIKVTGDYDASSSDGKLLVFNLVSVEDADILYREQFKLTIIRFCPLEAPFTGDYELSVITPGIFATPTFTPGIVTVSQGAGVNDRVFTVAPYPAFGAFTPIDFNFSMVCEKVVIPAGQATGVGCGSSTTLGPLLDGTTGVYTTGDDSMFTISLADDEGGASCGAEAASSIMLTKI